MIDIKYELIAQTKKQEVKAGGKISLNPVHNIYMVYKYMANY